MCCVQYKKKLTQIGIPSWVADQSWMCFLLLACMNLKFLQSIGFWISVQTTAIMLKSFGVPSLSWLLFYQYIFESDNACGIFIDIVHCKLYKYVNTIVLMMCVYEFSLHHIYHEKSKHTKCICSISAFACSVDKTTHMYVNCTVLPNVVRCFWPPVMRMDETGTIIWYWIVYMYCLFIKKCSWNYKCIIQADKIHLVQSEL